MSCFTFTPFLGAVIIFLIFLSALLGTLFPFFSSYATNSNFTSFGNVLSAGFLISTALVHLLPEASIPLHHAFPSFPISGLLVVFGIISVFTVENVTRKHLQQQQSNSNSSSSNTSQLIAIVLAITLSFHSFIEGLALGAAISNPKRFIAIATAILAHKFFAALTLGNSLATAVNGHSTERISRLSAIGTGIFFALVTPVAAFVGAALVENWIDSESNLIAALDCVSAGVFLYIGLVEILANEFHEGEGHSDHIILGNTEQEKTYGTIKEQELEGQTSRKAEITQKDDDDDDDVTRNKVIAFVVAASVMSALALWT